VSFSPYFPTGFEGVLTAYSTPVLIFFPQGFWRTPRIFPSGFGGDYFKMMNTLKDKYRLGGVLGFN
jgi:hypothetical protein